ncbi:DNA helicase [Tanacetum coccineum]
MSLQFPLLFIFGQPGFYPELTLKPRDGRGRGKQVTMKAYYKYQLHPRTKEFGLIFKGGRLFQQYVVTVFCVIEQSRLDFIRKNQNDLRSDFLSGLYDAVSRGDREGIAVGSKIMLPSTFTGGPRYMYSHYLDWPEIKRYMAQYPELTPTDRADIVCRVFEQKVKDFLRFLKEVKTFGYVTAVLYTIEFQKRGLPHYHTLLWVDSKNTLKDASQIDEHISAEIPDPVQDPRGYKLVTELMMHGPCGAANLGCKSPDEVRTVNGQMLTTFRAACEALGLLGDEKEWDIAIEESTASATSKEIRILFAQILIYCDVANPVHLQQELLFVYDHGGIGKTFLWKTIISSLRSQGKIVLAVASSGIASLLSPAGRTAHSKFKLPLELTDESFCHAKKKSQLGNLLVETDLIIWDEAPMNDKRCFETLDRTLKDLLDAPNVLFGGKTIVLGGDFRKTLPVKKGAEKEELIAASIAESYLWWHFRICTLKENMRLQRSGLTNEERKRSETFAKWLLDVGDGEIGEPEEEEDQDSSWITILPEYSFNNDETSLLRLINFIYDDM